MAESGRTADIQDDAPTEDYSCGYCLQKWIYMIDQRQLPCSHIFCLPCIQGQVNGWRKVHCGICQQEYSIENLEDLPKVTIAAPPPADVEAIFCDVCEKTPNAAAVFCTECEKKLCEQHLKMHDEYNLTFEKKDHKILLLDVYSSQPHLYVSLKCEMHLNEKLKQACSVCYKMFCSQCTTSSGRCKESDKKSLTSFSYGYAHIVHPVWKLAKTLRSSFQEQLKHLSEKITKLCKSEKESWKRLSEIEEETERMRETIIESAEEKIAAIRRESDQLVAEIQDYLCQSTRTVEGHVADLVAHRERLEGVWKSSRQMMSTSHDSQIVQNFVDMKNKLNKEQATEVKKREPVRQALVPITTDQVEPNTEEKELILRHKLCRIPNHLELVDVAYMNGADVYSVCITQSGSLLCGTKSGAQRRNFDTLHIEEVKMRGQLCIDVIQPFDDMIVASGYYSNNTVAISLVGQDMLESERTIFYTKATEGSPMCRLGQWETDVCVIYYDNKLCVHSLISNRKTVEYPLPSEKSIPYSLCVLPDSTILIGNTEGNLTRYRLDRDEGLQEIWSIDIADACNITFEPETGLVYSAWKSGVCIITTDGVLLGELKWDRGVDIQTVHGVAVSEGYIILACREQGLKKFKMMY